MNFQNEKSATVGLKRMAFEMWGLGPIKRKKLLNAEINGLLFVMVPKVQEEQTVYLLL